MKLPSDYSQNLYIHVGTGEHNKGEIKVSEYSNPHVTAGFSTEVVGMISASFDLSKAAAVKLQAN